MPKETNKKVVCSFEIDGPISVARELNELWGSMSELVELCKLISERVDTVTKRLEEVELCVKKSETLQS